ncbi:MAG: sigma-54-dependent Fis family transcriptional regulator [Candidatus Margulisbacteria bacterium]|nr:sigma-54-dependent Fis family transcriptional regulator [Candidatus Margulisiibacteriota bacterium]
MFSPKLLIIDDDETILFSFKSFLNEHKFSLEFSKNGKDGLEKLSSFQPNLVIADYKMPEMTGLEFIKASKILHPNTPVIIMSAFGDSNTKRVFLDEGAFEYIEKPFDIESVLNSISLALESSPLFMANEPTQYIGESTIIKSVFDQIDKAKNTTITMLIEGESGTGKDLIANYIHNNSPVANGPFISINCAAIPESLIESELFGYEKGAFTGADEQKIGKFEHAKNGTIFLDEIGELPLSIQAKLLRILQNKTIERIGGANSIASNARIIAATNKNLRQMVADKDFREDLYYRLTSFPLHIPALRNRENDITLIADYLLQRFCTEFNKKKKSFSDTGLKALKKYHWPGNIRELQNIISRIVLLESSNIIHAEHILPYFPKTESIETENDISFITQYTEKELLKLHAQETFKLCHYNKSDAAKRLGINYRTLIKRLES